MNEADIAERLERFIVEGLPTRRVLLENRDGIPAKPYLTVEVAPTSRTNPTTDASPEALVSSGKVYVTVVDLAGGFAKGSRQIADEVVTLFPYGLRISLTGGRLLIRKPADVLQGYRDGPDWRVPVVIDYGAEI